ncbi:MAG: glucosamine-6-phosphate deaminase [Clostridia bacterium]|nr:glucosamine-6-phosphate deaminase [Clostridia bacterium]
MNFLVCNTYEEVSQEAAKIFEAQLKAKPDSVLGLATGSTPLGLYRELIRAYQCGGVDFSRVTSINLDEYYPIEPTHEQSYRYFMDTNLFNHININKENTFVPNGKAADPAAESVAYDERVKRLGGIDLQLLGIGENGHIGFNEPSEQLHAGTHVEVLTESTRQANSRFFASLDEVPTHAITMGMTSILTARKIVLLACGKNKHDVVMAMLDDKITTSIPATLLKCHPDMTLLCDNAAFKG